MYHDNNQIQNLIDSYPVKLNLIHHFHSFHHFAIYCSLSVFHSAELNHTAVFVFDFE